jgi:hypothetical protein
VRFISGETSFGTVETVASDAYPVYRPFMLSQTRRALEDFDNQHEFERLAADILNALGYSDVEPMAPAGGGDGGRDIKFREGNTAGIGFVTLEKKIRDKFKRDLAKQPASEGQIALFCNVSVTPQMKLEFAKAAGDQGYTVEVFDLERMRSLLDSSLKEIRRRYLHIDDEISLKLRSDISKLLRFPDAFPDEDASTGLLEGMLSNQLPRRLFNLLMTHEERHVLEVPGVGALLARHLLQYYEFRQKCDSFAEQLAAKIVPLCEPAFSQKIRIHLRYEFSRFAGRTKDEISAGVDFLNYGITWTSAEAMFQKLNEDQSLASTWSELSKTFAALVESVNAIRNQL